MSPVLPDSKKGEENEVEGQEERWRKREEMMAKEEGGGRFVCLWVGGWVVCSMGTSGVGSACQGRQQGDSD